MRWLCLISLLLTVGCERKEIAFQYTNGPSFRIIDASYGTNHVAPGQVWRRLDKNLPPFLRSQLAKADPSAQLPVATHDFQQPMLVIWLREEAGGVTNARAANSGTLMLLTPDNQIAGSFLPARAWDRCPAALLIHHYPRRQKELQFRVAQLTQGKLTALGEFRVNNPKPWRGPHWNPEPLPSSRATPTAKVELVDFMVEDQPISRTRFQIRAETTNGIPLQFVSAQLEDPTGNIIYQLSPRRQAGLTNWYALFGALFPDEPACRLTVEWELPTSVGHEERITFFNLPAPADDPDEYQIANGPAPPPQLEKASSTVPGLVIGRIGLVRRGALMLYLQVSNRPRGIRTRVAEVRDNRGELWEAVPMSSAGAGLDSSPRGESHDYELRPPAPSPQAGTPPKSFTVTVGVYPTEIFTFHPARQTEP